MTLNQIQKLKCRPFCIELWEHRVVGSNLFIPVSYSLGFKIQETNQDNNSVQLSRIVNSSYWIFVPCKLHGSWCTFSWKGGFLLKIWSISHWLLMVGGMWFILLYLPKSWIILGNLPVKGMNINNPSIWRRSTCTIDCLIIIICKQIKAIKWYGLNTCILYL